MKKRRNILTLATGAIIVVILVLYTIAYVVGEGQVGVLTTFGKVVRVVDQPGLYWKAPWPIQSVAKLDARLHTDRDRHEETKTADGELVVVLSYYNWRIADPQLFYTTIYKRDREETLREVRTRLGGIVRDAKNDVFGRHAFSDLMPKLQAVDEAASDTEDEAASEAAPAAPTVIAKTKLGEIEDEILATVRPQALKDYGIEVEQVGIMRFELPEATTQVVFTRMRAEREGSAARIRSAGKGQAEGIKADADYQGAVIISDAETLAERYKAEGDVEAAEYNVIFAQNPEVHDLVRSFQALKTIINEQTILILSTDSVLFRLLNELPEKLLQDKGAPQE